MRSLVVKFRNIHQGVRGTDPVRGLKFIDCNKISYNMKVMCVAQRHPLLCGIIFHVKYYTVCIKIKTTRLYCS